MRPASISLLGVRAHPRPISVEGGPGEWWHPVPDHPVNAQRLVAALAALRFLSVVALLSACDDPAGPRLPGISVFPATLQDTIGAQHPLGVVVRDSAGNWARQVEVGFKGDRSLRSSSPETTTRCSTSSPSIRPTHRVGCPCECSSGSWRAPAS